MFDGSESESDVEQGSSPVSRFPRPARAASSLPSLPSMSSGLPVGGLPFSIGSVPSRAEPWRFNWHIEGGMLRLRRCMPRLLVSLAPHGHEVHPCALSAFPSLAHPLQRVVAFTDRGIFSLPLAQYDPPSDVPEVWRRLRDPVLTPMSFVRAWRWLQRPGKGGPFPRECEGFDFTQEDRHPRRPPPPRVGACRRLMGYLLPMWVCLRLSWCSPPLIGEQDELQGWLAVVLIGMGVAGVAAILSRSTTFLSRLKLDLRVGDWPHPERIHEPISAWESALVWADSRNCPRWVLSFPLYIVLAMSFAGISSTLVRYVARAAAGSGIPEVKTFMGGAHMKEFLGVRTGVVKVVGVSLSSAAGLSLGKEGPYVHIAACLGNVMSRVMPRYINSQTKKRELLSAAAAAGVCVAFGAPIGGILFSYEEASYFFPHKVMWRSFFGAVVAAVTLRVASPYPGRLVWFQTNYTHAFHALEMIPFLALGVIGGVAGAFFVKFNLKWSTIRRTTRMRRYPVLEILTLAFIHSCIQYWVPFMKDEMSEELFRSFRTCSPADVPAYNGTSLAGDMLSDDTSAIAYHQMCETGGRAILFLCLAGVIKMCLTVLTFGSGVPAGLFIPSLYSGAMIGRGLGICVQEVVVAFGGSPDLVVPAMYAVVGAAAVLGGVTRMTVSLVAIMFELTAGLDFIMPVMFAIMVAKWVGDWLNGPESVYEAHIVLNQYPFLEPKLSVPDIHSAAEVVEDQQVRVVTATGMTVQAVRDDLDAFFDIDGFVVVDSVDDPRPLAFVEREELVSELLSPEAITARSECLVVFNGDQVPDGALDLRRCADVVFMQVDATCGLSYVFMIFRAMGLKRVLVTSNGRLRGVITKKDLIDFLHVLNSVMKGEGHRGGGERVPLLRADRQGEQLPCVSSDYSVEESRQRRLVHMTSEQKQHQHQQSHQHSQWIMVTALGLGAWTGCGPLSADRFVPSRRLQNSSE